MKFNTKYFIFIVFFVLILSVSAVSATDIDGASSSDVNGAEGVVAQSSATAVQNWTIDEFLTDYSNITDNDTICIKNGTGNLNKNITLDKANVTIFTEGNVTIDAQNNNVHFEIKGNNVLIKGISFENFKFSGNGGAIFWSGINGTLEDCNFTNDTAQNGGAVYWNAAGLMKNCNFANEKWVKANGIYAKDNLTIDGGKGIVDVNVQGVLSGITVTVLDNKTSNVEFNKNINLTAKIMSGDLTIVDDAADVFRFKVNGTAVSGKPVQISDNGEYSMAYNVTAPTAIAVSANYTKANATTQYKNGAVVFEKITTKLNVTVENITYGENATVIMTISTDATGKLNVTVGTIKKEANIVNGAASISFEGLAAGKYTAKAEYEGNDNFTAASATADFNVSKANPNMAVNVAANKTEANVTISMNKKINGTASLKFDDGTSATVTITNGKGNYTIKTLTEGAHIVTVTYDGNDNFTAESKKVKFSTGSQNPALNVIANNITIGENATVTANVNVNATGDVTFIVNGTEYSRPVVNGTATLNLTNLKAGKYAVEATYSGDSNFTTAIKTADFNVFKIDTDMTVKVENVTYGDNTTITVNVKPNITGKLNITVNDEVYEENIVNGTATLVLKGLKLGFYNVKATYAGDDKYEGSIALGNFTIACDYVLSAEDVVKAFRNGTQYHANLKVNGTGKPIAGEKITVTFTNDKKSNPATYTIVTNENGTATLVLNANPGIYYITAKYGNQAVTNKITITSSGNYTISAEDIYMTHGDGTSYTANITFKNGTPISNAKVTIILNNKGKTKAYTVVTNENGTATLPIRLNVGQYLMTAKYIDESVTTKLVVLAGSHRIAASDVIKYYKNGTQYTVSIADLKGNPVAGQKVVVTLSSNKWAKPVSYTLTTNNKGIATLKINLNPGQYSIKATVGNDAIQNRVNVLPTLTSDDLTKPVTQSGNLVAKLVDGQGNPAAGKSIKFTVKAKQYTKTTDSNGLAKLPIRLGVGTWTINIADPATGATTTSKVVITK